jgi:hypothetical protein
MLNNKYNQQLVEHLVEEFGFTSLRATELLNFIAEDILYCVLFRGPIITPFGKMAMLKEGIQITEQNQELISKFKTERRQENIVKFIHEITTGK